MLNGSLHPKLITPNVREEEKPHKRRRHSTLSVCKILMIYGHVYTLLFLVDIELFRSSIRSFVSMIGDLLVQAENNGLFQTAVIVCASAGSWE